MSIKELSSKETQHAIKTIKDFFQVNLAKNLNLTRVSAPLFVKPETGLNDNLSGVEKAVSFQLRKYGINVEIIQSLAKWKRQALLDYGFSKYEGLYTDMNAIRPDEILDATHSIYVDQWDWEKIIDKEDRNMDFLDKTVSSIYDVFKKTQDMVNEKYYNGAFQVLPEKIDFVDAEELLMMYPDLTPAEREDKIAKDKKAVFITGIGAKLSDGIPHSLRSPDYDDWKLNGDIIFWNPALNSSIELSSMGIRVDAKALKRQLKIDKKEERLALPYHQALIEGKLPQTIGGGIGQSRICLYFLQKRHIGEVQASVWDDETIRECKEKGIKLL